MWVCTHLPLGKIYLAGENETTEDGSIVCQNLSEIKTTLRDGYALVRAASWLSQYVRP